MRLFLVIAALLAPGCGYVGDPQPPLINIPERVKDLAVIQRGPSIVVTFSMPKLTTEGVAIRKPARAELRLGENSIDATPDAEGRVVYREPVASWAGKELFAAVKVIGANGRDAGWSESITIPILPLVPAPSGVRAASAPDGVHLTWSGESARYRIFRDDAPITEIDTASWTDTSAEFDKSYIYAVQALQPAGTRFAESDRSAAEPIAHADRFAPAVPSQLAAVSGTETIELTWEPNMESDLAGYIIWRASGDGPLERLTATIETPAYSDTKIERGKRYRYALSAIDRKGNESGKSETVEVTAPQ